MIGELTGLGALASVGGLLEFQKPLTSAVVEQLRPPLAGADAALAELGDNR
jgi:hypothetical protein